MRKFYINGKFLSVRLTGVQRVGRELSFRLRDGFKSRGISCEILQPPLWIKNSRWRAIWTTLWEQFMLPLLSKGGGLINLCNTAPIFFQRGQLVVLHDAAVFDMPENYSKLYAMWARCQMKALAFGSSKLATVSRFSQMRLANAFGKSTKDFLIVREGCNHVHDVVTSDSILDKFGLRNQRYVLAVGSLQPGKNFRNVLRAMNYVDKKIILVIAGGGDSIVFSSGVQLNSDRYIHTGYLTDSELKSLYSNAECFLQASTYEGFGLPVIEAMTLGVPVVSSSAASLPEVCEQSALFFDPNSPSDIARAINELISNDFLRENLSKSGYTRSRYFDWNSSADDLIEHLLTIFPEKGV